MIEANTLGALITKFLDERINPSPRQVLDGRGNIRLPGSEAESTRCQTAGKAAADPLQGRYAVTLHGHPAIVEYEPDADLPDTEQVPLLEDGGIETFFRREVLPHVPDA